MTWPDIFLLCFALGAAWSLATFLLGGLHFGHGHGHTSGHGHSPGHGHAHLHAGHPHAHGVQADRGQALGSWFGSMTHPGSLAVFLAWFGGIGYLLTRHSGFSLLVDLAIAATMGLVGAWLLAAFLRFLQSREQPLDPADYEMVGVLGRVSSPIRPGGVGEVLYVKDGARRPVPARSDDGRPIGRGEEVIVTRYEKGIAHVRTWDAMLTQPGVAPPARETLQGERSDVQ